MTTPGTVGLGADIAALTRILLNLEAPADLQRAARDQLTPPTPVVPLPGPGPTPVVDLPAAAFQTTTPAPPATPLAPAPTEPVRTQMPVLPPTPAVPAPSDREAARAVLEQLSFLDD